MRGKQAQDNTQKASNRGYRNRGGQRQASPRQYRRAQAGGLYKTGARWGAARGAAEGAERGWSKGGARGGGRRKEQTDKIREPLTEVREQHETNKK